MGAYSAVIYDHDGTLVDSLAVVVEATNAVLAAHGFPVCPPPAIIKGMAWPTAPRMGLHAGVTDAARQRVLADAFYVRMHDLPHLCRAYDGVGELITAVAARGLPQAVVSNNSGIFVRAAMGHLGLARHMRGMFGEEDVPAIKPDPRSALHAAAHLGVEPAACLFLGDSPFDRAAAAAAGMTAVGVTWGIHGRNEMLAMGFDHLIDHPREVLDLLG